MSQTRELAAIMFTDIAGYTTLMGEDEEKAFELLQKNRELQKPLILKNNGRWIKELGDGELVSFTTAADAVKCACAIMENCHTVSGLKLHIGIHLGEVIVENDDVFGDGVNIASRIETIAPPGSILISEPVYKNVNNSKEVHIKFYGEVTLRHVKTPMRLYEIITKETDASSYRPHEEHRYVFKKSIAVLPFTNMSNDPEQEYFSDGMAEEIINSLSHLKNLKVAGRTSSFQFKGKNIDLHELGKKLNVGSVLEGSVRRQGNRLRITAKLVNVEDGYHIWSERYDRNMDDIFAIQDDIAFAITEKLKITLLETDRLAISKTHTQNTDAYELFLKGKFYLNRRGSALIQAMEYLQQAIDIDPDFALAYAEYANVCLLLGYYHRMPPAEVMPKAKTAADIALRLDNTLCEPYTSLGYYYSGYEYNWKEGKKNFLKSIEINPNYALGHYWYGLFSLTFMEGNYAEAATHALIAVKLEPFSAISHAGYALILYAWKKFDEAISMAKNSIELDANTFLAHFTLGHAYIQLKRYPEAIDTFKFAVNISSRHQWVVHGLLWSYCLSGNIEEARALMNELKERTAKEYIGYTFMALSAALLNDPKEAIQYLKEAFKTDPIFITLKYVPWPVTPALETDPEYHQFLNPIPFPNNT